MVTAGLERADTGSVVVAGKALGPLGEDALAGGGEVVTAARHDVYAGALRDFPKVLVVRAHIGVTAVDNTSHAFFSRGPHLVDHEVGIFEIRRRRRSGRSQRVGRAHSFEEAAGEGEVFVEKDGSVAQGCRWHILEDCPNDGTSRDRCSSRWLQQRGGRRAFASEQRDQRRLGPSQRIQWR